MPDSTPSQKNTESPEAKKSLYKEMDEIIDTLPGEHPFSVLTMGKQALKAANKVVGYINNEPMDNSELVGAVTDLGMAATGTNFARAAAAGGVKAAKGGLSIFGSFVEDPAIRQQYKKRTAVADAMEAKGVRQEEILREVGVFRDHDRQWRFEISDLNAKIKDDADFFEGNFDVSHLKAGKVSKLGNILDHEEMYKVWPSLRDTEVELIYDPNGNFHGQFDDSTGRISINLATFQEGKDVKSTMLHEIQHAIQSEEYIRGIRSGGTGANPQGVIPLIMETFSEIQGRFTGLKTDEEILKAMVDEGLDPVTDWVEMKETLRAVRSLQKAFKFMDNYLTWNASGATMSKAASKTKPGDDALLSLITDMNNQGLTIDQIRSQFDELSSRMYRADRGEVESTMTQQRMDLSKDERRRYFPVELGETQAGQVQDFMALRDFVDNMKSSPLPNVKPEQLPALKDKS